MAETVTVVFKVTGGPGFSLNCPNDTSIADLKKMAEQESKVPVASQRLFLKGKVLADNDTLSSKGVVNGSTLLMTKGVATAGTAPEQTVTAPSVPCSGGCGFFGSASTQNYCSKCWKIKIDKEEEEKQKVIEEKLKQQEKEQQALETMEPREEQADKTRCWECEKKIGLLGVQCRCGYFFCTEHRYAESHQCEYDYKTNERRKLRKANPVVVARKLDEKA